MKFSRVPLNRAYRLLHPKLVVLVVARDGDGRVNGMTAAWAMPVSARPPLICVSIAPKRYTYGLIKETGEFTVNVLTSDMVSEAHYFGTVSGREEDKFSRSRLTLLDGSKISTPIVREAAAALECRLYSEHEAGDHVLVIGEVVAAWAKPEVFTGTYEPDRISLLLHLGGDRYTCTASRVIRP